MALRRTRKIGTALVVPKVEVWKDTTAGELLAGDVYREGKPIGGDPNNVFAIILIERILQPLPIVIRRIGIAGRAKGRTTDQSYAEWCMIDVLEFDNVIGK
jgi:hypothetical protein